MSVKQVMNDLPPKVEQDTPAFFDIDRVRLVEEWEGQTRLYGEHALQLADAKRDHEELKAELELLQAELSLAVRTDPDRFGLPKTTEAVIEAAVITQPQYQRLQKQVIQARHKADVLQGMISTLEQRKKAMESLLSLLMGEFFSVPKLPSGGAKRIHESKAERAFNRKAK